MGQIKYVKGTGIPHSSFDAEFLTHDECSEWCSCACYSKSNIKTLSEEQLNTELEKGYADMKEGRTRAVAAVFEEIRQDY